MVDRLALLPIANRAHQSADPETGLRLAERNASLFEQVENELEMLKLFDGNGIQLTHAIVKQAILLKIQRRSGRLAPTA